MSGRKQLPRPKQGSSSDPKLSRSQSVRYPHSKEQMVEMEAFYKKKLNDTRAQLKRVEDELMSFKDRMAEDLSVSLDAAQDTENMNSPVNMTRLNDMYQNLRVNKWPKVKVQLRNEVLSPQKTRNIIQRVFKEAVTRMDSAVKPLYAIFTENMSQKEPPKKVQDHLCCCLDNLQLALFHSNKESLYSAAVMEAPEVCRELFSECYWLFCLMALSKTPVQPDWDKLSKFDSWECLPDELKHYTREGLSKPGGFIQHQQISIDAVSMCQTPVDSVFTRLEENMVKFVKEQLKTFHALLKSESPEHPESTSEGDESSREAVLNIALDFLRRMDQQQMADSLRSLTTAVTHKEGNRRISRDVVQHKDSTMSLCPEELKSNLLQRFSQFSHCLPLQQIYTYHKDPNTRQINSSFTKSAHIPLENLFKEQPESGERIRTVLTVGMAGVGKTLLTQMFGLDWAKGRSHQDVHLLFHFTFRELNMLQDRDWSLVQLISHFFGEKKEVCHFENLQLLFIFDGLDECRFPLDFSKTRVLTKPTDRGSVEELLVNLIKGDLLPSAHVWITTRPSMTSEIPPKYISVVTEVQGFTDTQKEQYFMERFGDKNQATAVISHIKKNLSLNIMCRNPGFCSIISNFVQKHQELPTTLTNLYICFLQENFLRESVTVSDDNRNILLSVGIKVFEQLDKQKENLTFQESDLREFGLDDSQIDCLKCPNVLEFLAALYVHFSFFIHKDNLLSPRHNASQSDASFYQNAVDWAVNSSNGHLDMFLRFLLGLSLSTNQKLLSGLLTETGSEAINHKTVVYINDKLNEDSVCVERRLNLLHCLNELNNRRLTEEIQKMLKEGSLNDRQMSSAQWTTLSFLLLSSDSDLEEFDLKKFCPSEKGLEKLLPVVKASRKANLSFCDLKSWNCRELVSVLSCSSLTHLDLSNNNLQDLGVDRLCKGLKSDTCRLTTLNLSFCGLTSRSCRYLASVLSSSSLTHLVLSNNDLQDSGVDQLCDGLKSAPCRLETLRLSGCLISERGGSFLALTLRSVLPNLRELDLSYNHLEASVQRLTEPTGLLLKWEPTGAQYLTEGLSKYFCELYLDPNRPNQRLQLSENNRTVGYEFPDSSPPVLCSPVLTGRCYWEVDFNLKQKSSIYIAVTYIGKGDSDFGQSPHSWALRVTAKSYSVIHNGITKLLTHPAPNSYPARVAVYLDYEAGYLSFFEDNSLTVKPLHTFHITFTKAVCAGFRLRECKLSLVDGPAKGLTYV